MIRHYTTNLRCEGCVGTIRPVFDADPAVKAWSVDLASPDKTLTVEGDAVDRRHVAALMEQAGYKIAGEIETPSPAIAPEPPKSYFPLVLILVYLGSITVLLEAKGNFNWHRAMTNFMGGFFLVFSFFKFLNLPAFAESFAMYDVVAKRSRIYAWIYPWIEFVLGAAYVARLYPVLTNFVTLTIMLVGTIGVLQSLAAKRAIRCACLGTVFNLPMSVVTLVEDVLMAGMAAAMLVT